MPTQNSICRISAIAFFTLILSACTSNEATTAEQTVTPAVTSNSKQALSPSELAAQRFAHNIGFGSIALATVREKVQEQTISQPELAEKILAELTPEDLELEFAKTYARQLSYADLNALAKYSESESVQRVFHAIIDAKIQGKELDAQTFLTNFTSDEVAELAEFGRSEEFKSLIALGRPEIKAHITLDGTYYAKRLIEEYNKQ